MGNSNTSIKICYTKVYTYRLDNSGKNIIKLRKCYNASENDTSSTLVEIENIDEEKFELIDNAFNLNNSISFVSNSPSVKYYAKNSNYNDIIEFKVEQL
jgi:hypothetical protein